MNRVAASKASIGLIVDNPRRDLAGMVLLGAELARRGHRTTLIPMNLRDREISAVDPDLVLLNYLRTANQDMAQRLVAAGYQLGLLDTEGGVGIIGAWGELHDHYGHLMAKDRSLRDRLEFLCAWGPAVGDKVITEDWYRADQVTVTGPPRFDWYHPSLRAGALVANPIEVPDDGFVLVVGSFPAANPGIRSLEEETEMRMVNTGYSRDKIEAVIAGDRAAMEATIALTRTIAADHPRTTFVYRPHPFERLATYHDRFADLPNVEVRCEGSAEAWVLRANAVIVPNDCTVGAEAAIADVPVIVTGWIVPENTVDLIAAAGHLASSVDDASTVLGDVLEGSSADEDRRAEIRTVLAEWFHLIDGRAHERVADVITDRARPSRRNERQRRRLHYETHHEHVPLATQVQDRLRMTLGLPSRFSLRRLGTPESINWDRSPKAFTIDHTLPLVEALNTTLPADRHVRARALRPDEYGYRYEGRTLTIEPAATT